MTRIPTDGWIKRSSFENTYKQEWVRFRLQWFAVVIADVVHSIEAMLRTKTAWLLNRMNNVSSDDN